MRTLTTAAKNAFSNSNLPMLMLVELDFVDGTVRLCNAGYSFNWNGFTWTGLGTLGSIDTISEGSTLQMYGISLSLSGVPPELISTALGSGYQGRNATIWLAPLTSDYAIIANPVVVFKGRMDTMAVSIAQTATITVSVESRLIDWDRARVRRYNDADQQAEFPGDRGFRYVDQMVNKELKFAPYDW